MNSVITCKDIRNATMSEEKRREAHNNIFAFYIGRPISYVLTIPFLYMTISPNMITAISIGLLCVGTGMFSFGDSKAVFIIGWFLFFLWNLFDGIDGNVARYKKEFSKNGDLLDTTAGYLAMVTMYMSAGICAFKTCLNSYIYLPDYIYLIFGGWAAILSIFPRLVLHKKESADRKSKSVKEFRDKNSFSFTKTVALNLVSATGFIQPIWIFCIIFDLSSYFISFYLVMNLIVAILTLKKLLVS